MNIVNVGKFANEIIYLENKNQQLGWFLIKRI